MHRTLGKGFIDNGICFNFLLYLLVYMYHTVVYCVFVIKRVTENDNT